MSNGELIPLETASPSLLHESHSPPQPQEGEQQSPSNSPTKTPEGEPTEYTKHRRKDKITVAIFFVNTVLANAAYSLMSPFFPEKAREISYKSVWHKKTIFFLEIANSWYLVATYCR